MEDPSDRPIFDPGMIQLKLSTINKNTQKVYVKVLFWATQEPFRQVLCINSALGLKAVKECYILDSALSCQCSLKRFAESKYERICLSGKHILQIRIHIIKYGVFYKNVLVVFYENVWKRKYV